MVKEIMTEANVTANDIDRISVCIGPGSFTGLRVALAFAKGFGLPRAIPVIGISALEALAAQADAAQNKTIVSVINVRRGQLCWAGYKSGNEIQSPITQDTETAKAQISSLGYDYMVGDGASLVDSPAKDVVVSGTSLAWLARGKDPGDYPPVPLYSRGPDAKLPGGIDP
jgi:tRNA threonylcarbamoyl adenosine modification protein YeaZ